ncbi:MAG TPA: AmmeMemoRadiSam system radical SAM enzyme, partial [Deferrisomatales bacterium]|nr:AmmeMemoRadiSam system radical SAM enzyme [Deferrisomatales bacterium]
KKPLYHLAPGSLSYSVATAGCNFRCKHCQNHTISQINSQALLPGRAVTPEQVVKAAVTAGCRSIAYTYTEPTVFFEFALACMKLARQAGLLNVFVTNGYLSPQAVDTAAPYLDAANVDLKAYTDAFYRELCGARLQPVLECIRGLWQRGVWLEVTTLVIPHHNDDPAELREIARFLVSVSPDMPWHVSGFYPTYQLTEEPPTPSATLAEARRIGLEEGLHYVYLGNRPGAGGEDTSCPHCGRVVIRRRGFAIIANELTAAGVCRGCGDNIAGRALGGEP